MSEDWLKEDPFADADDPAAREREERRREREEKRAKKAGKKAPVEKPAPPQASPPAEPPAPEEPPLPPRTPEQEFWDEEPDAPEVPPAPAAFEAPAERQQQPPPPAAPPPAVSGNGRPREPRRPPAFLKKLGRHPFLIFAVVAALFLIWFLAALFQPFHGDGSGKVAVTIPKGSSVSEVGDLLAEEDVIDNSTLFQVRVTLAGKRSEIYSGNFTLAENMSYGAAIDALSVPPVKRTLSVTIPEGYTRSQAAQVAEEAGVPGDYTKATIKSKYLDPAEYGGKDAKDLEGFLFPDTFELKPTAPVADLVQLQLQDVKRRIKGVNMKYAKSKNLTVFDVVTIASMVEDEAGVDSQRGLVASVIYNRLHEGMPLGIDATIRFATGNYTEPLTESELAIDSPYNSRTNAGLPPGPISNPGLASLEAAAHPPQTDYLYYVTTPGACGKLTFAKTEAEFEAAVDKYNSAREAAGGNSPDSCGE
ncbi:MAG TPA: endolytic transglycosylase MltG [Solirubrobacterales bacterium]|nr:endolytic transglycosylase MltG [Solirubrobacterales bacterium]